MQRRRKTTAGALAAVVVASLSQPVAAAAEPAAVSPVSGGPGQTVTLITGDKVRVLPNPRGASPVVIEPGPGRDRIGFLRETTTGTKPGDITVVPSDALALVASGKLDSRLFDVSELLRQHLADSAPQLPLIVTYPAETAAQAPPADLKSGPSHLGVWCTWMACSPGGRFFRSSLILTPLAAGVRVAVPTSLP